MSSSVPEKIRTRGFWRFLIRPTVFEAERLPYSDLEDLIRRVAVRLRGWDFPHFEKEGLIRGADFVGSETDWNHHVESWRFFQSGQFAFLGGMKLDWHDQSVLAQPRELPNNGRVLGVVESLWTLTEVFELAARLATSRAGAEEMAVIIELGGIEGRQLFVDDWQRGEFFEHHKASVPSFEKEFVLERDQLIADPDDAAVSAAIEVFMRFGWRPDRETLRGSQAELRRL